MSQQSDERNSLDEQNMPWSDDEADFAALTRRLGADGAAWRATLPGIETLQQRVSALAQTRPAPPSPVVHIRKDTHMAEATNTDAPAPRRQLPIQPARIAPVWTRFRTALAVSAAVLVVALFAGIFALQSRGGPAAHPTGNSTTARATATPLQSGPAAHPDKLVGVPGLTHTPGVPIIATSDPRVIYMANSSHLRRSDDGGATWHDLPLPASIPTQDTVSWIDLFVSPLNANTVWSMANLTNPNGTLDCPVSPAQAFAGTHTGVAPLAYTSPANPKSALGGVIPCQVENVSTDGGQTWKLVTLPSNLLLNNAPADMQGAMPSAFSQPPAAQGDRLFMIANRGPMATSFGMRLFVSADGGATWQATDAAIQAAGQEVCRVAADPKGTSLLAITATNGCAPEDGGTAGLWRSEDGGAHWSQATLPPGRSISGMAFASGALYAVMPTLSQQAHVVNQSASPQDVFVSTNSGRTWTAAPAAGVTGAKPNVSGPIVTLADGSVAVPFVDVAATPQPNQPLPVTLYRWRADTSMWKAMVTFSPENGLVGLQDGNEGGHDILSVTTWDLTSSNDASQYTYTVRKLAV